MGRPSAGWRAEGAGVRWPGSATRAGGRAMKRLAEMTGPEVRSLLDAVAKATRDLLPPGTAFVVVAFDEPGEARHVGNADRPDAIRALRGLADRLEAEQGRRRAKEEG